MINKYFQQEMSYLKDLSMEFSKAHPALAPMLSGASADPDVERLLEGVAFLTGMLRQKLDDELPEVIHDLIRLIQPHYLRPIPSAAIVAFTPKQTLKQSSVIPAGVSISSIPADGTNCLFRTVYDVEVHPLKLLDAVFSAQSGSPAAIRIMMELNGLSVSQWNPNALRFHLAGDYAGMSDIYVLLMRFLKRIVIKSVQGGSSAVLPAHCVKPVGFSNDESLIPYPTHAFPGYRILQEYLTLPDKFFFFNLTGWEMWTNRGEGSKFELIFEFESLPFSPPRIRPENVVLFATPVINIFSHEADPITLDHRKTHYAVRPSGANTEHYQVYSIDKVVGYVQGTAEERTYAPFEFFTSDRETSIYHTTLSSSPIRQGLDVALSIAYPPGAEPPVAETLSVYLTCTNGSLPEQLTTGDICQPTSSTPEFVDFKNITPPTPNILPPLGKNILWRLLSHFSLHYLSLLKTENLRSILELYLFPDGGNRGKTLANQKRIAGIENIHAAPADHIISRSVIRGQDITIILRQDHFAGPGDMFLFGSVLDHFLASCSSINSFTRLTVKEAAKGEIMRWPARLGNRHLI
jgi:type VI secretion system protein ImpG